MENEYIEKLKKVVRGRTIVFIDAANLECSVRDMFVRPDDVPDDLKNISTDKLHWSVDYHKLNSFFKTGVEFKGIRFYCAEFDTSSHQKFRYFLKNFLS